MSNLYTSLWWRSSWYFSMRYFDVTGVYWCRSRCRAKKLDLTSASWRRTLRIQSSKSVSEYHVTWAWHRCGASRLTGVLSSRKIPNDSSPWMSPFSLSLSHLFILPFASLPPLSLSREEEDFFEVSTRAKNYTCQRHDFGFDDFVMESRFGRRFFLRMSFLHARHLYRYSRDTFALMSNHMPSFITTASPIYSTFYIV